MRRILMVLVTVFGVVLSTHAKAETPPTTAGFFTGKGWTVQFTHGWEYSMHPTHARGAVGTAFRGTMVIGQIKGNSDYNSPPIDMSVTPFHIKSGRGQLLAVCHAPLDSTDDYGADFANAGMEMAVHCGGVPGFPQRLVIDVAWNKTRSLSPGGAFAATFSG